MSENVGDIGKQPATEGSGQGNLPGKMHPHSAWLSNRPLTSETSMAERTSSMSKEKKDPSDADGDFTIEKIKRCREQGPNEEEFQEGEERFPERTEDNSRKRPRLSQASNAESSNNIFTGFSLGALAMIPYVGSREGAGTDLSGKSRGELNYISQNTSIGSYFGENSRKSSEVAITPPESNSNPPKDRTWWGVLVAALAVVAVTFLIEKGKDMYASWQGSKEEKDKNNEIKEP